MVKTPQLWSTDCPQKRVKVEIRYPEDGDYTWVEIPTAQVELHETKEGTPDHHRTAKVVFPTEWGDVGGDDPLGLLNNVREIVDPVVVEDIIMARVSFKNDNDEYVLKHVGFVGGVGNVNVLESKFWIYDFATMCQSVPFSESYNRDDTVEQVLSNIASAIEEDTPVPLKGVVIQDGGTSFEYENLPTEFTDAVKTHNTWIDAIGNLPTVLGAVDQFVYNYDTLQLSTDESEVGESLATLPIFTGDSIFVYGKQFQSNRHTIVDALEWVSEKTGAMWQFQPTIDGEGVTLLVSLLPHRYTFIQDEVLDGVRNDTVTIPNSEDYTVFDDVRVLNNTALEQINPYNTVEIRGAKSELPVRRSVIEEGRETDDELGTEEFFGQTNPPSDTYPYVKVRNEPLYQAAGQTELSKRFDSDASTIEQARGEAQRRLRELLNNPTEGSIELKGNPFVTPYDRIDAFEVCGDFVETQPQPVAYEVHTVTHTQRYGRQYECSVDASIYTGEDVATEVIAQMEEI